MNKTRIALSFDDGRIDNYKVAIDILKKMNIPATFNITTAYVTGIMMEDSRPCKCESMTVENVRELKRLGFEIAGHGHNHLNTVEDIKIGIEMIREWLELSAEAEIGFASPNSNISIKDVYKHSEILKQLRVPYVRVGLKNSHNIIKKIIRKISAMTGSVILYKWGFADGYSDKASNFILYSVPIMNKATLRQVQGIVKYAAKKQKNCVLMFHSIVDRNNEYAEDAWAWDKTKFFDFCEWLLAMKKKEIIDISNTCDISIYKD